MLFSVCTIGLFSSCPQLVGLTERNLEDRFKEHIIYSIHSYVSVEGDLQLPSFNKLQKAISEVIKLNYQDDLKQISQKLKFLLKKWRYNFKCRNSTTYNINIATILWPLPI